MTTEHQEQVALFQWCRMNEKHWPELALFHAIPNGGHRHPVVAKKMKAEGTKAGILDTHLPVARRGYHSLYIEMKAKGGRLSDVQKWWIARLQAENNLVEVCYNWIDATKILKDYLSKK